MGDADRSEVFDENSLRADIVKVWGEHGAHTDVFDHMLRLLREAQAGVDAAAPFSWRHSDNTPECAGGGA